MINRLYKLLRYRAASLFVLLLAVPAVQAHESIGTVSHALAVVDGKTVNYYLTVPQALNRLMFATTETAYYQDYFRRTLLLSNEGQGCSLAAMSPFSTLKSGNQIVHLRYQCAGPVSSLAIASESLLDLDDKHVQTVRVVPADDLKQVLGEAVLDLKHRSAQIDLSSAEAPLLLSRIKRFLALGVEHILTGYDHVLFIVAVILGTVGIREAVKVVTAFTLAHSITLGLGFFGVVSLPAAIVEPLIALTIVYVAIENLWLRRHRLRWLLIFGFGLIHGLGFVGVLQEITFSKGALLSALLAFNLGIELGQLLIVVPLVALLLLWRERSWQPRLIRYGSIATGVAGLVWLLERVPMQAVFGVVRDAV